MLHFYSARDCLSHIRHFMVNKCHVFQLLHLKGLLKAEMTSKATKPVKVIENHVVRFRIYTFLLSSMETIVLSDTFSEILALLCELGAERHVITLNNVSNIITKIDVLG